MQDDDDLAWREAFDELLVFEQDFDTAMQILMFQDEKVARLSLEDPEQTRKQRARRAKTRRRNPRSFTRKRRRVESSQAEGPEPPSPSLSSYTQSSETWSQWTSDPLNGEESQTQDVGFNAFVEEIIHTPLSGDGSACGDHAARYNEVMTRSSVTTDSERRVSRSSDMNHEESVAASMTGSDMATTSTVTAGSATTVASLFTTGSGKTVSVSTSRLRAYEEKLRSDEESVAASMTGSDMATTSTVTAGSATTVASLFTTGSGKTVSVSTSRLRAYEEKLRSDEESVAASMTGSDMATTSTVTAGSATTVASLFTTGSGKTVSVSTSRLRAYEEKLRSDEESVAASMTGSDMATTSTVTAGSATTVASLFTTGSGKTVSVSTSRLRAYEEKLRSDEESVAASMTGSDMATTSTVTAGSATTVASLFTTGSGKTVSVSTSRLRAYEEKLRSDEESVAASMTGSDMATTSTVTAGSATTVASLFTTGSGKTVSVSTSRLRAYEEKLRSDEESVAASMTGSDMATTSTVTAGSATTVASLFTTGSGKTVSVSTSRLRAYEEKLRSDEESVAASMTGSDMATTSTVTAGSATTVASLFTTGSGKTVSVSTSRLRAYEEKLRSDEESVAVITGESYVVSTTPAGVKANYDVSGVDTTGENVLLVQPSADEIKVDGRGESVSISRSIVKTGLSVRKTSNVLGGVHDKMTRQNAAPNEQTRCDRGVSSLPDRSLEVANPLTELHRQSQRLDCGDKENVHPENVLVRKTAALSKPWGLSLSSKQLNSRLAVNNPENQVVRQQKLTKRALKPSIEPRSKMIEKRRFHPPVASKRLCASESKSFQGTGHPTRRKKQKVLGTEVQPFIYKESMKISLTALMGLHEDGKFTGGDCEFPRLQVLNRITAENAINVRFRRDDSLICFSEEAYETAQLTGPYELYRQLRAGNHILKTMGATFAWFLNHFRWIVWKLASMERAFPRLLLENYLTKDQVLKQITHRYQRDVNDAQRSILKKILHRDASSLSCMVLCIAAVLPFPTDTNIGQELPACWNMALVLTDGWYSVYAVPDAPLASVLWKLHAKSSIIGTKLATWNASLQNSTEGIDPLECAIVRESQWKNPLLAKEDLTQWPYLQLRYNSTRRVGFDTRLGVEKLHYTVPTNSRHRKQQPQVTFSLLKSVPLKSLEIGGGMVRSVRVRVTRISPVLHLQAKEWTLGPRILCEEQLPLYFQLRSKYARVVMEKKQQQDGVSSREEDWFGDDHIDVPPPTPFIKVDVECTHFSTNEHKGVGCGILTIWRPSEELLSGGLREGSEYFVTSLTVNWKLDGGRGQDAFLRLSTTKHSGFEEVDDRVSLANDETKNMAPQTRSQRVCVDVQQATMDYRANFEDGLSGRRNERRPTIDVCVCVVLVAAREIQDYSSSSVKRQIEVSLLDPNIKPKERRYVEHVFVTDQSCHLMSIRVSGMEVSMPKKKSNSPLKRASSSSFVFHRGSKSIWKEGAILCLSGLEVSHYDEQLRVLDCVLVESTQIVSFPSKKSPLWGHFHLLQREIGIFATRGSASHASPNSSYFAKELTQLKKYVERDILRMDFVPSQECDEHHVEVVELERLTQDLQAHEQGSDSSTNEQRDDNTVNRHLRWDANVIKILPLRGTNKFMFPRDVIAFACVNMGTDDKAFRTVYLTRDVMLSMQALLLEADPSNQPCQITDGATETDLAQLIAEMLNKVKQRSANVFRFEVRQSTNERLMNSWKPWERLHASYWIAVTVAGPPTAK